MQSVVELSPGASVAFETSAEGLKLEATAGVDSVPAIAFSIEL